MTNEEKILEMLASIQTDMNGMKADVNGMKADMNGMKADMNGMKADINGMKADMNGMKADMNGMKADMNGMKAGMNGMKADIGELKADVSNLKTEAIKTNLRIENEIIPKLKVLAEGHAMLSETLAPKSKVDELQSDVELLKIVVKNLNSEVQQLKKAQ